MPVVELRNLTKRFGSHLAVDALDLTIAEGEILTLLGPSGCGKTTTLRMIAGLEDPDEGTIRAGDRVLYDSATRKNVPPDKRSLGMVFQSYAIWPHMTVLENVAYPLKMRRVAKAERLDRARKVLDLVGLSGQEDKPATTLSGGQQQRVAVARAIVFQPELMLFDEPLSNLDAKLREHMRQELRALQKRLGVTALYVTHDQEEALTLSDRIVVMNRGKIEQIATPEEIYARPATRFVADFIGRSTFIPVAGVQRFAGGALVEVGGTKVIMPADKVVEPSGEAGSCLFVRPEKIRILAGEPSSLCLLPGTIRECAFLGDQIEYLVEIAGGTRLKVPSPTGNPLAPGAEVRLGIAPEDMLLYLGEADGRKPIGMEPPPVAEAPKLAPARTGPLSHIRVLDLGRIMAAPWATQILADLGADVIKVERPGVGDDTRAWGPPFLAGKDGNPTKEAGYYLCVNRGKRSITLDMTKPEGQELVRRLAADADIVLENFKPGALARYGLDSGALRKINPRLIYCSLTGFGQDGPRREQAAYDFAIQAMGGLMSVTGGRDDEPGGGPQKVGVPIVDLMTGMYATVAVLAALARRGETGQGETIDLAMLDVQAAFLANQAMNYLVSGRTPRRGGNRHPNIQPQDVFPCADGYLVLAVGNDGQFRKLCEAIGRPDWGTDERFATNPNRVRNNPALTPLLTERFRDFTRAELSAALDAAGVPCAPINEIPQVFEDPQIVFREMLRHLPHPSGGTVPQVVSPLRFADAPLSFDRAPPLLGQHNSEILAELGYDEAAIAGLAARGVI